MKQDIGTGKRGIWRVLQAGAYAMATAFVAPYAWAQSAYDCRNLETHAALPSVEGRDGTFFAIRPDLQAFHGMGEPTIALLAELQAALAANGTTLVLLPVPTRAQVMIDQLPPMAAHVGFDADLSTAVHEDMIARLRASGLTVADPLMAMRAAARNGAKPFFKTDMRPTVFGMQILAKTIADTLARHPKRRSFKRGAFISQAGREVTLPSPMRLQLQSACQANLPQVLTRSYSTLRDPNTPQIGANDESTLVVLGTDITETAALNLPGFVSEATGMQTLSYGLKEGGAFGALTSYMTSKVFQTTRPTVLVWEFPVYVSMADRGEQPLRELIFASKNTCDTGLPFERLSQGDRLHADLDQVPLGKDQALLIDAGDVALPFVKVHFTGSDGVVRTRGVYRKQDQILTGRFFLPLSTLRREDLVSVEIEGAARFGDDAQILLCS